MQPLKVYLAGKVTERTLVGHENEDGGIEIYEDDHIGAYENRWRASIIGDGKHATLACDFEGIQLQSPSDDWPILERIVLGVHDYVGPFYVSRGHGFIGEAQHGYSDEAKGSEPQIDQVNELRKKIIHRCLDAISSADLVFVWLAGKTAFATLAEVGWARAKGKQIFIGGPKYLPDLWFIYGMADDWTISESPAEALRTLLAQNNLQHIPASIESPMEQLFWDAAARRLPNLSSQFEVPPYRLDFALADQLIAIEIDGHDYHKTKEQRTHDAKRDRYLQRQGWTVVRFTGSEVYQDAAKCVNEVLALLPDKLGKID